MNDNSYPLDLVEAVMWLRQHHRGPRDGWVMVRYDDWEAVMAALAAIDKLVEDGRWWSTKAVDDRAAYYTPQRVVDPAAGTGAVLPDIAGNPPWFPGGEGGG